MKYRTLGHGLEVSAIGIGCMTMIGGNILYGSEFDESEAVRTIHEAIDLGVTLFDTAELYGPHTNEALLGGAIKDRRDKVVIATKFGFKFDGRKIMGTDSSPANARAVCEASLKRLGVDHIDLFYQHRVDPAVPIEETVGALDALRREGKIRHIGLSEAGPGTIARAAATAPISALQSEYSIWERDVEDEIIGVCRANGIGFVPYSPLGRGFLAGTYARRDDLPEKDWRRQDPRWMDENFDKNMEIVSVVRGIGEKHGASPAQVALAWLLAQGDDIVPIPGVKRRLTMKDSVGAVDLSLDADDLAAIAKVAPKGETAGPRYGEMGMKMVRL